MNMSVAVLIAVVALAHVAVAGEPPVGMITKAFSILPSVAERISAIRESDSTSLSTNGFRYDEAQWKTFFSELGITWPEGSSIRNDPGFPCMVVRNTPDNLEAFEKIMTETGCLPLQMDIQAFRVSFETKRIQQLTRESPPDKAKLLALWQSGEGTLLDSPRVVTQSGIEACSGDCDAGTNTQYTIRVLPEVNLDGRLMNVTISTPDITTSVLLSNGAVVLLGGGSPSANGKTILYTFLAAHVLNVDGNHALIDND